MEDGKSTVVETQETQDQNVKQQDAQTDTVDNETTTADTEKENSSSGQRMEDKLAEVMAENARLKREKDKASSEAARYKRESMENKTEAEKQAIEKAEEDAKMRERLAELEKESALNKLEKSFVTLGYSEEMAKQAAEAQYENNTDLLFTIQKKFFAEKERAMKAKLMREMPAPTVGNDDSITVTKEQFDAMNYSERLNLLNNHPKVYEQLVNGK